MDFISRNKRYFITILIGIIMVVIISLSRGILAVESKEAVLFILSDACAIPGIFILAAGILLMVSNEGLFNGISYGFKALTKALKRNPEERKMEDYHEYYSKKTEKKISFGHLILTGGILIIISILCAFGC